MMDSFILDDEFQMLTLELSDAEFEELEENIFDKGCLKALHIWNGTLLDGHKRYVICKKWGIPFSIQEHDLKNRHEAIAWICRNNLGQPTVSNEINTFLIGKHYEAAKSLYLLNHNATVSVPKCHYRIAGELGELYNIAPGTVYKYGMYARGMMKISTISSEFTHKILTGKIKVSHENVAELSKYPPERLRRLYAYVLKNKIVHVCYSEMHYDFLWESIPAHPKPVPSKRPTLKDNISLKIKQMPAYDPDAEVSSLTLTIPSWISSIKRTQSMADLTQISDKAKENLNNQLHHLVDTINTMLSNTKEET